VDPLGAIAVGAISSVLSSLAVGLKYKLGYDDSLDVVGVHLVGGLSGSLLVGLFATEAAPAGVDGLLYGGGSGQLVKQAIACGAVLAYSFIVTLIIAKLIDVTMGLRISQEAEITGIDLAVHAETAYEIGNVGSSRGGSF
jgi:Amt family ammonium transporter